MIGIQLGPWIGKTPKDITADELVRLRKPIERAILKAELLLEATVKQKLIGPRHGRFYRLPSQAAGGRRRQSKKNSKSAAPPGMYQASAPGEPPANVTGSFRLSINHTPVMWNGDSASGEVGTNDKRARIFEFGGRAGKGLRTRILARPYMAPAFLEAQDRIETILAEATQS